MRARFRDVSGDRILRPTPRALYFPFSLRSQRNHTARSTLNRRPGFSEFRSAGVGDWFASRRRKGCWPMDIGVLPGASRRRPRRLDQENIRISAALDHIRNHGNLDGFPASRGERIALVTTAAKHGLLEWNRGRGRYELTSRGHRQVRAMHRTSRNALRGQGGTFRMGMNAVVSVAATVMVGGAVFLAFHPDAPPKFSPSQQAAGGFADHTSASAKSQEI